MTTFNGGCYATVKQLDLTMKEAKISNGANLGFEKKLWKAADKLRNNMGAAEYKHIVFGLNFPEVYF